MAFELPSLPWDKDALEPVISAETIDLHYGKHHQGYLNKLNGLVEDSPQESESLEGLILNASGNVFNNAAQVWNHTFYWNCLSPQGGEPGGELANALIAKYGSLEAFREAFISSATGNFGSGWTWLVVDQADALDIINTSNADNPLRNGQTPLLTVDVWEHAYYVDYRNDRGRYLKSIWSVLNWEFIMENYASRTVRSAA